MEDLEMNDLEMNDIVRSTDLPEPGSQSGLSWTRYLYMLQPWARSYIKKASRSSTRVTTGESGAMATEINEKMLAAYNEAGHAIVGVLQGCTIDSMIIYASDFWAMGGFTWSDVEQRSANTEILP